MVLEEGSTTLAQLLDPSVPIFKDIYFFNLTNPEEFQAGAKPNLSEIGPYSYRLTFVSMHTFLHVLVMRHLYIFIGKS